MTNTVDWYYALPADMTHRSGERVAVEIPTLDGKIESLVLPFSAVLHDIHGGQWVYEQTAPHTYTRRRIQVARLSGSEAVCRAAHLLARRSSPTDPPSSSARSS